MALGLGKCRAVCCGQCCLCVDLSGREEAVGVPTAGLPPIFKAQELTGDHGISNHAKIK